MNKEPQVTNPIIPLMASEKQLCRLLSVGQTKFREMYSSGRFAPLAVRLGRCKRWRMADVELWVDTGCLPRQRFLELTGQAEPVTGQASSTSSSRRRRRHSNA